MDIQLDGVQKTLLMPLYGRAKLSRVSNDLLVDSKAVEIVDSLDFDFSAIEKNTTYAGHIYYLVRAKIIDDSILDYLENHPQATIINLGSGLDTTFYRIDNKLIRWYDIDLPGVIELRNMLIPETERSKYIKSSIFDMDWIKSIKSSNNILFICTGVFEYFDKEQVVEFLVSLAENFPGSEIIFNTTSNNKLNSYFVKKNMKKMGMNASPTRMGNIINCLKRLRDKLTIVEYYSLESKIELKKIFDKKILKQLKNYYAVMRVKIIHLRLSSDTAVI